MPSLSRLLVPLLLLAPAAAQAAEAGCEAVKAEIGKRLDERGLKGYRLVVIGKDEATTGTVVGSCERGEKAIVYERP